MENTTTMFIVLGVVAAVALILALMSYLKNRGYDVGATIDGIKNALFAVNTTLEVIKPFLPESVSTAAFDKIMKAAEVGVGYAEQLYLIGELEPGERKEAARKYIEEAVGIMGIEVTPEVERLIEGAIENEVLALGHYTINLPSPDSEMSNG